MGIYADEKTSVPTDIGKFGRLVRGWGTKAKDGMFRAGYRECHVKTIKLADDFDQQRREWEEARLRLLQSVRKRGGLINEHKARIAELEAELAKLRGD